MSPTFHPQSLSLAEARPEPIVPKILPNILLKFPKLLLYYSLRVDPLFHEIILTVSQK